MSKYIIHSKLFGSPDPDSDMGICVGIALQFETFIRDSVPKSKHRREAINKLAESLFHLKIALRDESESFERKSGKPPFVYDPGPPNGSVSSKRPNLETLEVKYTPSGVPVQSLIDRVSAVSGVDLNARPGNDPNSQLPPPSPNINGSEAIPSRVPRAPTLPVDKNALAATQVPERRKGSSICMICQQRLDQHPIDNNKPAVNGSPVRTMCGGDKFYV